MYELWARRRSYNHDDKLHTFWDKSQFHFVIDNFVDRDIYKEAMIINTDGHTCAFYQEFPIYTKKLIKKHI